MPKHSYRQGGKVGKVMGEFKRGTLHSGGSGKRYPKVKDKTQALAIALNSAKRRK